MKTIHIFLKCLYSLLIILATTVGQAGAQQLNTYQPPPRKPKPQKVIPRFPPQFNSKDTIGRAQRIKDSLDAVAKKKAAPRSQFRGDYEYKEPKYDTIIKILSQKEDAMGNVTIEREIRVGTRSYYEKKIKPGQLNRPFDADTINKDSITLQVVKKAHRMYVYHKHRFLTSYKVVFGPDPYTQKEKEGDKRTPEGWFKILEIRPHADWQTFMLLNYPNEDSWKIFQQNISEGIVTKDSRIGGAIGIHSVAPECDYFINERRNWTDGCIALTRPDMAELTKICKKGTPILIKLRADSVVK
jgi:hypothetical protein